MKTLVKWRTSYAILVVEDSLVILASVRGSNADTHRMNATHDSLTYEPGFPICQIATVIVPNRCARFKRNGLLPDISQIRHTKRPSYHNGPLDSIESSLHRRESHRFWRSNMLSSPLRLRESESGPFPRSTNPCPTNLQFLVRSPSQQRSSGGGGTPNRWMRSRIAANKSRGTATSAIWNVT